MTWWELYAFLGLQSHTVYPYWVETNTELLFRLFIGIYILYWTFCYPLGHPSMLPSFLLLLSYLCDIKQKYSLGLLCPCSSFFPALHLPSQQHVHFLLWLLMSICVLGLPSLIPLSVSQIILSDLIAWRNVTLGHFFWLKVTIICCTGSCTKFSSLTSGTFLLMTSELLSRYVGFPPVESFTTPSDKWTDSFPWWLLV